MLIPRLMKAARSAVLPFALFATIVSVADIWLTLHGSKAALIAYTGWEPSSPYVFSGLMAWMLVATGDRRRAMRLLLVVPLLLGVVSGHVSYASRGEDFGNPYLRVSRWQPIWTMAIPAAWAALLLLLPAGPGRPSAASPRPTPAEAAAGQP